MRLQGVRQQGVFVGFLGVKAFRPVGKSIGFDSRIPKVRVCLFQGCNGLEEHALGLSHWLLRYWLLDYWLVGQFGHPELS
jgi:hypothetical protein